MPASKKQLAANRRNALKSTGPKTITGKAITCKNAVTHGLTTSDDIIVNSPHLKENADEYRALIDSLTDELQPNGTLQQHLVIKIANCLWRYKRIIRAETAKINEQLQERQFDFSSLDHYDYDEDDDSPEDYEDEEPEEPEDPPAPDPDHLHQRAIPNDPFLTKLMFYEMRLDRQLSRSYKLLTQLQLIAEAKRLQTLHDERKICQNEPISPQPDHPQ